MLISAVFALVLLGFFAQFAAAEVVEKGAGTDTYPVQTPAFSKVVLRDWYDPGLYRSYSPSCLDGYYDANGKYVCTKSGWDASEVDSKKIEGQNYYSKSYQIFYYVLIYPNGTEKVLEEFRHDTSVATTSDDVPDPKYNPNPRAHHTSQINIPTREFSLDIPEYGHYKVELRRVEIPAIIRYKNPSAEYNLDDSLVSWHADSVNTMYYRDWKETGSSDDETRTRLCAKEGPIGNISTASVIMSRYGNNYYSNQNDCSAIEWPSVEPLCHYSNYESGDAKYSNGQAWWRYEYCWLERSDFKTVKAKDLQVGVIWTHEFDVSLPLTITEVKACGDIECKTSPAFRPAEDSFFFINTSEPAGLQMNVWKTQTAEETREKYSDLKLGAEVKGDTSFMKITNDGVGYRKIITTDKFSYPLKIKWRGKYAFYQAGMVNLFYGDHEDFSMGNNNGDITGFYLGLFDSGAMNTNYDGNVNLGQPEVNKEHTYELQILKDRLIWFLDGNKVTEKTLSSPRPASRIGIIAYGGSVEFQLTDFQIDLGDGQIKGNINGGDKFLNFTANSQEALSKYSNYKFSIISEPEWGKPYVLQNGKIKLSGGTNFPTQPSPESRYDRHGCGGDPNGCGWYGSSATFKTQDKFDYPVKIKWKGTIEAGYSRLNYNNIQMMYRTKDNFNMNDFKGFFWDGWYRRLYAVSDVVPTGQQWPPSTFLGDLSGTEHTFELDVYKDKLVWLLDGSNVMEQALSQPPEPGSAEVRALGELRVSFILSELTVNKGDLVLKTDFSAGKLMQPVFEDKRYLVGLQPQYPVSVTGNTDVFEFFPQDEGDYTLEFVAHADERSDTFSQPIFVSFENGNTGVAGNFISNPFVQDSGGGGAEDENSSAAGGAALPLAAGAVLAAGVGGIVLLSRSPRTGKVITGVKEGLTDYGSGLLKRSKEILDFIQEEKNGYWTKIWEDNERRNAAVLMAVENNNRILAAQKYYEENKQSAWAANQAQEAIDMLKSGKGEAGWFVQRMEYLSENAGDKELSAQLAGLGMQIQSQLEARPAVVYTPELGKSVAPLVSAPAKAEPKGILDSVMGFFGNALNNAKKLVGGVMDAVGKVPLIGQPIVQAARGMGEFAYGVGKSVYNTAKALVYDLPVGIYNWATTSKDHLGDIGNAVKFVADGIGWAVTHPAQAAEKAKELGQQVFNYCTGSAVNAGECAGEVALVLIPASKLGSVGKIVKTRQAVSVLNGAAKVKYTPREINALVKGYWKEKIEKLPMFRDIKPNFGKMDESALAKTTFFPNGAFESKFFYKNLQNAVSMWGDDAIRESVEHEFDHILSKMFPDKFWKGNFDFTENVREFLMETPLKYYKSGMEKNLDEIVIHIKTGMKNPQRVERLHTELSQIGTNQADFVNFLRGVLNKEGTKLYKSIDKQAVKEAHEFWDAARKLGKLAERSRRHGRIPGFALPAALLVPATSENRVENNGISNVLGAIYGAAKGMWDFSTAMWNWATTNKDILGDTKFAFDRIFGKKDLSTLPPEEYAAAKAEIELQKTNFGVAPNVFVGKVKSDAGSDANFDTIVLSKNIPIKGKKGQIERGFIAHEMAHVHIFQNRFKNSFEYMAYESKYRDSFLDELEADALIKPLAGEAAFKRRVDDIFYDYSVSNKDKMSRRDIEMLISVELLAERTGVARHLENSEGLKALLVDNKIISAEKHDKIKDLLDSWLKNTIDKGKVGSEAEAGEVQERLMEILPQ